MTLSYESLNGVTPPLVLGCNAFGHLPKGQSASVIEAALEAGITVFHTANVYAEGRSESELGRLLAGRPDVRVWTKVGHPSSVHADIPPLGRTALEAAVADSRRRLRRDRLDVCLLHFPDSSTPIGTTLEVLSEQIASGKIGAYGVSNFPAPLLCKLLEEAERAGLAAPAVVQAEYSLLQRSAEHAVLPLARSRGIPLAAFFPLASGLLTGKHRPGEVHAFQLRSRIIRDFEHRFLTERNWTLVADLESLAARHGRSLIELALGWLATRPGVTSIIAGATGPEQVTSNAAAAIRHLSDELLVEADALTSPYPTVDGGH